MHLQQNGRRIEDSGREIEQPHNHKTRQESGGSIPTYRFHFLAYKSFEVETALSLCSALLKSFAEPRAILGLSCLSTITSTAQSTYTMIDFAAISTL